MKVKIKAVHAFSIRDALLTSSDATIWRIREACNRVGSFRCRITSRKLIDETVEKENICYWYIDISIFILYFE